MYPTDQPTLKLSRDYLLPGSSPGDWPAYFEAELRLFFYLGPAQVTDQPTLKLSRDYFLPGSSPGDWPAYFEAEQRLFLPGSSPLTTWPTFFWSWAETIFTWVQPRCLTSLAAAVRWLAGWSAWRLVCGSWRALITASISAWRLEATSTWGATWSSLLLLLVVLWW